MRMMRGRRGRWIGVGLAAAVALTIGLVATAPATHDVPTDSGGPVAPTPDPQAVGPIVYYEILDAEASRLVERRLDGHSLPRIVASRADVAYGRGWAVDPTGTTAIVVTPDQADQKVEAISVATGDVLWATRTPNAPIDNATWSADGRRFAIATIGSDGEDRSALVFDVAAGRAQRLTIPEDAVLQGFVDDGSLILRQRIQTEADELTGWQFLRLDPATATLQHLRALPAVGPSGDVGDDVDPAAGVGVDSILADPGPGTVVRLWTLGGDPPRVLAKVPSVDRLVIDPTGNGVAIAAGETIRLVTFDGRAADLFTSMDAVADFAWSAGGDYLAVTTDRRAPNLTVIERATGRSVPIPQAAAVAQLLLVRMIGGVPLPVTALSPAEPGPTASPAPAGPDITGFGGLASGWVERTAGHRVVHVQRLMPTEGGGQRVVAEMPPLDLGPPPIPDDGGPELRLLPRPGTREVLVWIGTPDTSAGWLWDGSETVTPVALPADWPANAFDLVWRPDGQALAASAGHATIEGEFEGIFVVAELGAPSTTEVPVINGYDRLEGWWSATELRVGHGVCFEGCPGRYANSARLRVAGHRQVELTAADRADGPIDTFAYDGSSIILSSVNDDRSDDVVITWPTGAGREDGLEVIGFAADGRSLFVKAPTANGTDILRVRDPIGRSVDGRLPDPQPERITSLAGRELQVQISPDDAWALVTDRVEEVRLVRLADGRSWSVDRDRFLVWLDPPG